MADPDLQIRVGGGGGGWGAVIQTLRDGGGPGLPKTFFRPPPWIRHWFYLSSVSFVQYFVPKTSFHDNRQFPSLPWPLYQSDVKCSAFDMEMIFILMQIKPMHFHKKGCAPGLILNVRVFWNSEDAY